MQDLGGGSREGEDVLNAQHTPGPWEAIDERADGLDRIVVLGPDDERAKHRHGRSHIVEMRGWTGKPDDDEDTVLADARLIAAAPDLLKACRDYLAWVDRKPERKCVVAIQDNMRAAIAKAEPRP